MRANVGKLGLRQQATGRTNCRLSPDDRPQPGSLDRAHRSGRAGGDHQNLATTLLLPRRTPYPLGAPPHFASATALALGEPVQSCPGTAATDSTPSLTTCLPLTRHPAHGTSPQLAPSSVREHLLLRTPLAIPPSATTRGPPSSPLRGCRALHSAKICWIKPSRSLSLASHPFPDRHGYIPSVDSGLEVDDRALPLRRIASAMGPRLDGPQNI